MPGLIEHLKKDCPLVVLIDWELPGLHESKLSKDLLCCCPNLKVIALSSKFEARQAALAAGADAFVSKAEPPEAILAALNALIPAGCARNDIRETLFYCCTLCNNKITLLLSRNGFF